MLNFVCVVKEIKKCVILLLLTISIFFCILRNNLSIGMPRKRKRGTSKALVPLLEEVLSAGTVTSRAELFEREFFKKHFCSKGGKKAVLDLEIEQKKSLCRNPVTEAYSVISKCKFLNDKFDGN